MALRRNLNQRFLKLVTSLKQFFPRMNSRLNKIHLRTRGHFALLHWLMVVRLLRFDRFGIGAGCTCVCAAENYSYCDPAHQNTHKGLLDDLIIT